MTYSGQVHDGKIVLDAPVGLPDGSRVDCVVLPRVEIATLGVAKSSGLFDDLMAFAGKASELPEDASTNHDHYLYGLPKK